MTKSKEVRFITSILHWLSEFPNTPISSLSSPTDLADPNTIYQTLTVLLYQEDLSLDSRMASIFRLPCQVDTSDRGVILPIEMKDKIEYLGQIFGRHFENNIGKLKHVEGLRLLYDKLNLYKLIIYQDQHSLCQLSELILKIGIYSSKLSTFGLTSIHFLSDADKEAIEDQCGKDFRTIKTSSWVSKRELQEIQKEHEKTIKKLGDERNEEVEFMKTKSEKEKEILTNEIQELQNRLDRIWISCDQPETNFMNFPCIDEDYVKSIEWENETYQELVYNLITN